MRTVDRWVTIAQAARALGVSRQRVWQLVRAGRLRARRVYELARLGVHGLPGRVDAWMVSAEDVDRGSRKGGTA